MGKGAAQKVAVLGIDALDPRLTKKYVEMGLMPNMKKYIELGAQREDLVMLGGHPTVTPPMWTTLATGAYANVHGITGFYRQSKKSLDVIEYNIDSRRCLAEQMWNVTAEAGFKTLVWHWPGSSWPPSSDSPNLMVVDGTSPGAVGMAVATVDEEFIMKANTVTKEIQIMPFAAGSSAPAPCVVEGLEIQDDGGYGMDEWCAPETHRITIDMNGMESSSTETGLSLQYSTLKEAKGWAAAPLGAKEFVLLLSKGLVRYPGLMLQNDQGEYDHIAIYKSKKNEEPIVTLSAADGMVSEIIMKAIKNDVEYTTVRNMRLLSIEKDGSDFQMYVSCAMDIHNDSVWHPKRLYQEIVENVGYVPPTSYIGCQDKVFITDCHVGLLGCSSEMAVGRDQSFDRIRRS